MLDLKEDWPFVLGITAIFGLLSWSIFASFQEEARWEQFKVDHACKVIAKISGDVFNTFGISASGSSVVGVAATPDKTGWLCDDGVTYYK